MNPTAYFVGVPLRLQVPEFRIASPENPQVKDPNGMSIEAGFGVAFFAGRISALTPRGQQDIRAVAVVPVVSSFVRAPWFVSRIVSMYFARSGSLC